VSKLKLILLCCLSVMVVSAIGSTSASAILWLVAAKPLFEKPAEGSDAAKTELVAALPEEGGGGYTLTSTLTGGAKVVVLCKTFGEILGSIIETKEDEPLDETPSELKFKECSVDEPTTCKTSAEITLSPLDSELFLDEVAGVQEVFDEWTSLAEGGIFTTIPITGCSGEGSYKVTGGACALVLEPEVAALAKLMEFQASPLPAAEELCLLKFKAAEATFTGEFEFKLDGAKTGSTWAVDKV
jgi:hypothetical protein